MKKYVVLMGLASAPCYGAVLSDSTKGEVIVGVDVSSYQTCLNNRQCKVLSNSNDYFLSTSSSPYMYGTDLVYGGTYSATVHQNGGYWANTSLDIINGTYDLQAGDLLIWRGYEIIGKNGGTGRFIQSGGTHNYWLGIGLGWETNDYGSYELQSGLLLGQYSTSMFIGNYGKGDFIQSGGTAWLNDFAIGVGQSGSGSYVLKAGDLKSGDPSSPSWYAGYESVGIYGYGQFTQSGGTNKGGQLQLGVGSTGVGSYDLQAGELSTKYEEVIANAGVGTFTQRGGVHSASGLVLGKTAGSHGSYELQDGTLSVKYDETIGKGGIAHLTQYKNNHDALSLTLGADSGSEGNYDLKNGDLYVGDHVCGRNGYSAFQCMETIGKSGVGYFTHRAGTNTARDLILGESASGDGSYELQAGLLNVNGTEIIGKAGIGHFSQSGGSHTVNDFTLAYDVGGNGNYDLVDGQLTVNNAEIIGKSGTGTFIHRTGNHQTKTLILGDAANSNGSYDFQDGQFSISSSEIIGKAGVGQFSQSGGTHQTTTLTLGDTANSSGSYELQDGQLKVANTEILGKSGVGQFTQTGGIHEIGQLLLGSRYAGNGSYTLKSGELKVNGYDFIDGHEFVGALGSGQFTQTGGTHSVKGGIDIGSNRDATNSGEYFLYGGSLALNGGLIAVNNGDYIQNADASLSFHLNIPSVWPNARTVNLAPSLIGNASLRGQINVDLNYSEIPIDNGYYGDLIEARNIDLHVDKALSATVADSKLKVKLGEVDFNLSQYTPIAYNSTGYLAPAILQWNQQDNQVYQYTASSLALFAVEQAAAPVVAWQDIPKMNSLAQANVFMHTDQTKVAMNLARLAYGDYTDPRYHQLASIDIQDMYAVALQDVFNPSDIIISVRGTVGSLPNLYSDLAFGNINPWLKSYVNNLSSFVGAVYSANNNANIKLVGHSLGGGLAEIVGYEMGVDAYGFNPAPIGNVLTAFTKETAVIRGLHKNSNGQAGLVNIRLDGDPVSGLTDTPFITTDVGQTLTLQNRWRWMDYLASIPVSLHATLSTIEKRIIDVAVSQLHAAWLAHNHSSDTLLEKINAGEKVIKLEFNGQLIEQDNSYVNFLDSESWRSAFLTPFELTSLGIQSISGVVEEGVTYLVGADPEVIYGFSFLSAADSPKYHSVLLPTFGDPSQMYEIDILSGGYWEYAGLSAGASEFLFGPGGVDAFRVLSYAPIAMAGSGTNDVFFGLTYAGSGIANGTITALGQDGNPLPTPIPAGSWLFISGLFTWFRLKKCGNRQFHPKFQTN